MEFIETIGFLGFGSRLKALSERVMAEAGEAYNLTDIDFEARWFTTFYLIANSEKPVPISEIAHALKMSHPAIIKITNTLLKQKLITSAQGSVDKRKRLLTISTKGKELLPKLEPLWKAFTTATKQLFEETGLDMIGIICKLEKALDENSLTSRVYQSYRKNQSDEIEIVEYETALMEEFRNLNLAWLNRYFTAEEADEIILSNPETEIIAKNGAILFARLHDKIVGTGAIHQIQPGVFLISKMAVVEDEQHQGAGTKILNSLIERGKQFKAEEIVLLSDEKLQEAVSLYRKAGFEISSPQGYELEKYERASEAIFMKLKL